jgi:ATP-dependent DNA ligase
MACPLARRGHADPPEWIRPQLTELVDAATEGADWLHEIKFDGYPMQAHLNRGFVRLLTRTGLDWTHKYQAIAKAVASPRQTSAVRRRVHDWLIQGDQHELPGR